MAKGSDAYRRAIRGAVRGLWSGALNYDEFWDMMDTTTTDGLTNAWHQGAQSCGVLPDELTREETIELGRAVAYEKQWISGFAVAIEENSKQNGGKLAPLFNRAKIWIGRWEGVHDKAMTMACKDQKLEWVLGETDQSCESCLKLNGQVRRASFWNGKGVLPRQHGSRWLACRGFRCLCRLVPTNKPASRGPLPSLP
jgi:hypothetical protein